jgi:hypothetical protein
VKQSREELTEMLSPKNMQITLSYCGLYQLIHETIKYEVTGRLKSLYGYSDLLEDRKWSMGTESEKSYNRDVRNLGESPFQGSIKWLIESEAISQNDEEKLETIYNYRHTVAHEVNKLLVDEQSRPDIDLLISSIDILKKISRFWTNLEIQTGGIILPENSTIDDVIPGNILIVDLAIQSFIDLVESNSESADKQ